MTPDRAADQQLDPLTPDPYARLAGEADAAGGRTAELDRPATPTAPDDRADADNDGDDGKPAELDPEVRARRDAALQHVLKLGDPLLRTRAVDVDRFDRELEDEVRWMAQVMDDALGIGLAATQVGILHRVLVYRSHPDDPVTALVNPVIEWADEETEAAEEGCLSIPGVHVEVARPARVKVRALDVHGRALEVDGQGLEARVIQHEIDHLDGVLMIDRVSREARREAMVAVRRSREAAEADGDGPVDDRPEDRGGDNRGSEDRGGEDRGGEDRGGEDRGGEDRGGEDGDPDSRR